MSEAIAPTPSNPDFFLDHMWLPMADYAPDIPRLKSLPVAVAVGETSAGQLAYRSAVALAEQLGKEPAVFPGDHGGFRSYPRASPIASKGYSAPTERRPTSGQPRTRAPLRSRPTPLEPTLLSSPGSAYPRRPWFRRACGSLAGRERS